MKKTPSVSGDGMTAQALPSQRSARGCESPPANWYWPTTTQKVSLTHARSERMGPVESTGPGRGAADASVHFDPSHCCIMLTVASPVP